MKYTYEEIQAPLLVEKLLNDPAECDTCAEIEKMIYANAGDHTKLAYTVYDKVRERTHRWTLCELLNSLSARGEITILSIDNAANEIMINWCGMTGCILYRADDNTWQMHT